MTLHTTHPPKTLLSALELYIQGNINQYHLRQLHRTILGNFTKPNLPNQTYQTQPTKPNLPNPTYKTKPTKPNQQNST